MKGGGAARKGAHLQGHFENPSKQCFLAVHSHDISVIFGSGLGNKYTIYKPPIGADYRSGLEEWRIGLRSG
jgi:hypothetical protein